MNSSEPDATSAPAGKSKSMRTRKRRQRRRRQIAYLVICGLSVVIFGFALSTLIRPAAAQDESPDDPDQPPDQPSDTPPDTPPDDDDVDLNGPWRKGYAGHGTTHEQLGQPHYAPVEYSAYTPTSNYTEEPGPPTSAMNSVYNFTHFLYDKIIYRNQPIPDGYIIIKNGDTLALGPKVEQNDWRDLLRHYWLLFIIVFVLLLLIIIVPFIAVCYCCFCCCRRCRQGCPPCTTKQDAQRRFCCGICLLLLIIGLIFGIIIALVTNRMLDDGFAETTDTMQRGGQDTCTFLKDVSDHMYHLMVYNYEEFETHVTDQLNQAHKHILLDLADTSESNSLAELERILDNMPEALQLMREVEKLETDLRFYGAQLRDGVRGIKRDINFAVANLCQLQACQKFLITSNIEYIDTSECLHFDKMPNTSSYVKGMEEIVNGNFHLIPQAALARMQKINGKVMEHMTNIIPPITQNLGKGRATFRDTATELRNKVDAVISDIHLKTVRSSKSFDDIYERFGPDRSVMSLIACMLILLILFILVVALLCGCFGRRRTGYGDDCCSKATGASCLLFAILLIFCVFSFLTLIGLFYFIVGFVAYQGACAPLRDQENNAFFRQLDSTINLNDYAPAVGDDDRPPMRMSGTIKACHANQTIFNVLRDHHVYDIRELARVKVLTEPDDDSDSSKFFDEDLSNTVLLTDAERKDLDTVKETNLSAYHSAMYLMNLCNQFTPMNLNALAEQMYKLSNDLEYPTYGWAKVSFWNEGLNTKAFHRNFVPKLNSIVEKMRHNLMKIDELILYENQDFATTIKILTETAIASEKFIKTRGNEYINTIIDNMTESIHENYDKYVDMVINDAEFNVGHCAPLAYIYYRGVDHICHRIVDPINGFWVGILLCALLLLPILFVAHKLMCLYKKIYPFLAAVGAVGVVEGGSDYMYDAYSERDREHVPLANVPKKRRKAYERRREQQDYYEDASPSVSRNRSGGDRGGGGGGGRDDAPGSSSMRYNDMAPTHWDHEPPRYHNPPAAPPSSEYERPPPYYYPGASEQD
ncbi:hypothetical protein KR067_003527 [Drosophila pandora]|nr:hypothetical protein KR067_003527 [Drosophila pandora]